GSLITANSFLVTTDVNGSTNAYAGGKTVITNATTFNLKAKDTSNAASTISLQTISAIGSDAAVVRANVNPSITAYIAAQATLNAHGAAIILQSTSDPTATADAAAAASGAVSLPALNVSAT